MKNTKNLKDVLKFFKFCFILFILGYLLLFSFAFCFGFYWMKFLSISLYKRSLNNQFVYSSF